MCFWLDCPHTKPPAKLKVQMTRSDVEKRILSFHDNAILCFVSKVLSKPSFEPVIR